MKRVQDSVYHVLVEGGQVGPYDRRTIVGMRIRKALAGSDVLLGADGRRLTVRELVRQRPAGNLEASRAGEPSRGGSYSVVQGVHAASLVEVQGSGCCKVPAFQGEMEVRVQTRALRLQGRFRESLMWRQHRIKVPLEQIVHARVRGQLVDLGLRAEAAAPLQRVTLDLLAPDAAAELAASLPHATAWPQEPGANNRGRLQWTDPQAWGALLGTVLLVGAVLVVVWAVAYR